MAKKKRLIMQGEYSFALCTDDWVHVFATLDDGEPSKTPMCRRRVLKRNAGGDDDLMCLKCATRLEEFIGLREGHLTDLATD